MLVIDMSHVRLLRKRILIYVLTKTIFLTQSKHASTLKKLTFFINANILYLRGTLFVAKNIRYMKIALKLLH